MMSRSLDCQNIVTDCEVLSQVLPTRITTTIMIITDGDYQANEYLQTALVLIIGVISY